jgi:hypothetical protein
MRIIRWGIGPIALALLIGGWGCGNGTPTLTQVTGRVTFRNLPVQNGTIVFIPDSTKGERGPIAKGKIGADGSFSLSTGEAYGAPAGWYRVTVAAVVAGPAVQGQPFAIPQSLLPEKYRDPELSELACQVKPGTANRIDFDLR